MKYLFIKCVYKLHGGTRHCSASINYYVLHHFNLLFYGCCQSTYYIYIAKFLIDLWVLLLLFLPEVEWLLYR